jgi:hypothetical protein
MASRSADDRLTSADRGPMRARAWLAISAPGAMAAGLSDGVAARRYRRGVTLAAYAIPVSLAYSTLAGLPPQVGVYGYMLGGLGYALLVS